MQQRDYSLQVTLDDRRCQMKSTSGSEMEKKNGNVKEDGVNRRISDRNL